MKQKEVVRVRWEKPESNWKKLNTDGCSKGNPDPAAVGGLIRNEFVEVFAAFTHFIGNATNVEAELIGLKKGLEIYKERGWRMVWAELDAKAVIELVQHKGKGNWKLQTILAQISFLSRDMALKLSYIFREENQIADLLANNALQNQSCIDFDNLPSAKCNQLAEFDRQGFSSFRFR